MSEISKSLRVEGPEGTRLDNDGVSIEYLGVRVIIASAARARGDRGIWVIVQTDDGAEETIELFKGRGGTENRNLPEDVAV